MGGVVCTPSYAVVSPNNKGGVIEHIQSFEEGVPDNWKALKGKLEISSKHYKHNKNALKWQWKKGDRLIVTNEANMIMAGKSENGGIIAWIYNEKPIEDKLIINLGNREQIRLGNPLYTFEFYLNFEGWRALWIDFKDDAVNEVFKGERVGDIEQMEIISPINVQEGEIYFDLIEFVNNLHWCRAQDYQIPIQRANSNSGLGGTWERGYYYINQKSKLPLEELTDEQKESFSLIEKRLDNWVYGTGKYSDQVPIKIRKEAMSKYITEGIKKYETLKIERHEDDSITGVPLFASRSPYIKMGKQFGSEVSTEIFLPIVFDYKLNGNRDSLKKFIDLLDYYYDQGWAEGSGLGTLDHETNRSSGYFVAVYLMREELKKAGLYDREMRAMNWYTDFGKVYGKYQVDYTETTADEMRTHFLYRLLYVLAMDNSPEKVQAMKGYLDWVESALEIQPNFSGTIKPDYTGFHHRGIYANAYSPNGYHVAAFINYLLHGTIFELNQESQENLKGALIASDIMSKDYNLPQSLTGRFPKQTAINNQILPAYAYMALSGNPTTKEVIDRDMAGIFMRLWQPDSPYLKDRFNKCRAGISYIDTLGGLELMLDLVDKGIEAKEPAQGFFVKPYGGLTIYRNGQWMAANKGWSQYVWDYESGGNKKENVFGRYIAYGSLQIMANENPKEDGYDVENGWDWNRIPGTTTKYLPLDLLASDTNNYAHRTFSDKTFLGGVSSEGKIGMFSTMLHDTQYDTSFYANKSAFYFGDEIICLGSGIRNNDKEHNTETTLFQSSLNNNKQLPFYINSTKPITQYPYEKIFSKEESAWIMDPYGNGYYIPNAKGLHIKRNKQISRDELDRRDTMGEYTTAWISHGTAPKDEKYEYVIKVQTTPEQMQKYSNKKDYVVLQQDDNAHILKHHAYKTTAYAIFNPKQEIRYGILEDTDTPIMVMIKEKGAQEIVLSISDPDLRLPQLPNQTMDEDLATTNSVMKHTTIILEGTWKLTEEYSDIRILAAKNNKTTIQFDCINGESKEVVLERQ